MSRHERRLSPQDRRALLIGALIIGGSLLVAREIRKRRQQPRIVNLPTTTTTPIPATPIIEPVPEARPRRRMTMLVTSLIVSIAVVLAVSLIPTSRAFFSDSVQMQQIGVTAGTMKAPAQPTASRPSSASSVFLSWTLPGGGLPATSYDVERRKLPTGFTGTSTFSAPGTSATDGGLASCGDTYAWRTRARNTNLVSSWSPERQFTLTDMAKPVVGATAIIATSGTSPIAGFMKPGGTASIYAQVADNCSADAAQSVTFDFGAYGSAAATYVGNVTPIVGGPSYNFRYNMPSAPGVSDGTAITWNVIATDTANNSVTQSGTVAKADAIAPFSERPPQAVATLTNYFAPEIFGAVQPSGTFRIYAQISDGAGSGTDFVTSNSTSIDTSPGAVELSIGTAATAEGTTSWNYSSSILTARNLAAGVRAFSITSTDKVGNQSAAVNNSVAIDDVVPQQNYSTGSCISANGGTADVVENGDSLTFSYTTAIDPNSVVSGWNGSGSRTVSVSFVQGGSDYMTITGANFTQGNGAGSSFDLSKKFFTASGGTFGSSSVTRESPNTYIVTFGGGAGFPQKSNGQAGRATMYTSSILRSPAGKFVAANSGQCGASF